MPSKSEHGEALDVELRTAVTVDVDKFLDEKEDTFQRVEGNLKKTKDCLIQRIDMRTKTLTGSKDAQKQVCTLIGLLDSMFRAGYANIRETWILIGDNDALLALGKWCQEKSHSLPAILRERKQHRSCFEEPHTSGEVRNAAPRSCGGVEGPGQVSASEVTLPCDGEDSHAPQGPLQERQLVRRGSWVHRVSRHGISSGRSGADLFAYKTFNVLRIVDRFNSPTSSGWCDVMINGHFTDLRGNKVWAVFVLALPALVVCVCKRCCSFLPSFLPSFLLRVAFGKEPTTSTAIAFENAQLSSVLPRPSRRPPPQLLSASERWSQYNAPPCSPGSK